MSGIRYSPTAFTGEQLDRAIAAFAEVGRQLGVVR
jgi:hypothetical protein